MKRIIILSIVPALILVFYAGMTFNQVLYEDWCMDMGGGINPGNYDYCVLDKVLQESDQSDLEKSIIGGMHYTWDLDRDGFNDCKDDGSCDDSVDYSIPKYEVLGIETGIVFDEVSKQWVDKYGICHTCTPENGFSSEGALETNEQMTDDR